MSYTKGPWKRYFWQVRNGDDRLICDCDTSIENESIQAEEVLGNAALIAAAPDLVEALEQVEQALQLHLMEA